MEEIGTTHQDDKITALKNKLMIYGFNEPFSEENYDLVNHIISDFNKVLLSFKSLEKEKTFFEEKNNILEEQIGTLNQQIDTLLERNKLQEKLESLILTLNEDKKKLVEEVNELKQEISDKNKDIENLVLTIEKNKNSLEFLKIENQ